ncbi:MAG: helix-turn-helix transcriptional regulator [Oscillospiraceae bacterium]|nr:helix-turn-helix transcriptional regulator [Oscillospiraceae bacterium]
MDTNRELNYRLYIQTEENFKRTEIKSEFARYDDIKNGNVEKVRENIKEIKAHYYEGKGMLSDSLLRNNQYHFAIGVGMIARVCIDGGMEHNIAYTLSDIYIRRGDKCRGPQEVIDLTGTMMLDFASRMAQIRKEKGVSIHVRRTVDYVYENLNRPLTLKMAAEHEHLDPSYLSKIFAKEMGVPLKAYILNAKINTARNILTFSEFSIADIADSLGFSSQSAFAAAFRKITGLTPMQYRSRYSEEYSLLTRDEGTGLS